jgi:hypothetical protein
MKILYTVLFAAAFATAACGGKKDEKKVDPTAKPVEPTKADPAKADPATPDPAKADPAKADPAKADPAKADPAKTDPAKAAPTVDEEGAKALAVADKVAKVVEDGGADCAKIGAGLKASAEEVKAAITAHKEWEKDDARKQEFAKKYEPQLEAKMKAVAPKLEKCKTDADVKAFTEMMGSR